MDSHALIGQMGLAEVPAVPMDALIDELDAAASRLSILMEGYRDFARLDLSNDALNAIQRQITVGEVRLKFLSGAVDCLKRLQENGYPDTLPALPVSDEVLRLLNDNVSGMNQAIKEFKEFHTTQGVFVAGKEGPIS